MKKRGFGELQGDILKALHEAGAMTPNAIAEHIGGTTAGAVSSTLSALRKKKAVEPEGKGLWGVVVNVAARKSWNSARRAAAVARAPIDAGARAPATSGGSVLTLLERSRESLHMLRARAIEAQEAMLEGLDAQLALLQHDRDLFARQLEELRRPSTAVVVASSVNGAASVEDVEEINAHGGVG